MLTSRRRFVLGAGVTMAALLAGVLLLMPRAAETFSGSCQAIFS